MNGSNYRVVHWDAEKVVLKDLGPWDRHPTVTNDAEQVVADMAYLVGGRRLLYYDSEGELTELRHEGAKFTGFAFPRGSE